MATIFGTNGVDELRGTATSDAIHGFWGDDSLVGVGGNDRLFGGNGADTLDGGDGTDLLDGGGGLDFIIYSSNTSPVRADLRTGVVSFPGKTWPAETIVSIEGIEGGSAGDTFIGDGAANTFRGNNGNDALSGNYGSDTLIGGAGNDSLDGGNGPDSLAGGFGNDTMRGDLHDDIFFSTVTVEEVAGDDAILISDGVDFIDGGAGSDTLVVTAPTYLEHWNRVWVTPGVKLNMALGTLVVADAERERVVSIENVETGDGDDAVNGSTADNLISVHDGDNVVFAGAGNDTIIGGEAGEETLNGGAGDDEIHGNGSVYYAPEDYGGYAAVSTDALSGGEGNDTIYTGWGMADVSGGEGSDTYVIADRVFTQVFSVYDFTYLHPSVTIMDFERGEKIELDVDPAHGPLTFVGETTNLAYSEIGYEVVGNDTIITLRLAPLRKYDDDYVDRLQVTLADYTGPLPDLV